MSGEVRVTHTKSLALPTAQLTVHALATLIDGITEDLPVKVLYTPGNQREGAYVTLTVDLGAGRWDGR